MGNHHRYRIVFAKGGGTLTHARLTEVLSYDPKTGIFLWRVSTARRIKVGDRAGSLTQHSHTSYRVIRIDQEQHYAHKLAWFYVHGVYPAFIDHKDLNGDHNWIDNLRESDKSRNGSNVKRPASHRNPYRGVWLSHRRWRAMIKVRERRINLGAFDSPVEAAKAYDNAVRQYRGGHGRVNFPRDGELKA